MGLTLAQMRTKTRGALGVDTSDTPIGDDTSIDSLLNQSAWEIFDVFKFREKEAIRTYNTVIGTEGYNVAADLEGLQDVSIEDPNSKQRTQLLPMDGQVYDGVYVNNANSRGKPTHYVRRAGQIILYPTPNAVYAIYERYWKTIVDITGGVIPIPQSWHPMIWMNAAFYGFLELGDVNKAVAYRKLAGLPSVVDTKESVEAKEHDDRRFAGVQMIRPSYP